MSAASKEAAGEVESVIAEPVAKNLSRAGGELPVFRDCAESGHWAQGRVAR